VSSLAQALVLLERGLVVIPVPRPVPGAEPGRPGDGKVPALAWKPYQSRRPTEAEIRTWFATEQNLAVLTGSLSGVVVVDADSDVALRWCHRNLPWTPWQVRTTKGFHLYYQHPGTPVRNKARIRTLEGKLALDTRGDGGYVIGPGSLHASGRWYAEAGDWEVDRLGLPVFNPECIKPPEPPRAAEPKGRRPTGDVIERARRYLAAIPVPVIGCGSDVATLSAACRVRRGFDLSPADAEALLWEWCGNREGWTRDWVRGKVRAAEMYGSEPMGGLL
jgi:hypothetical protein